MTADTHKIFNMVLAILVSVGAWVFVVYNYEPMTEMKYSDVPVECIGEDALADRGLAVSEMDAEGISVTLTQRRTDTARLSAEDIEVTADVSNCIAGDNVVTLKVTGPEGTTVADTDGSTLGVKVGRAKKASFDIDVIYGEGAKEGEEPISYDLSHAEADVACTEETLSQVKSVAAVLDPEEVTDEVKSFTAKLKALDKDGEEVAHVVIYPDEISLDASAGFTKTVSLVVPVKNSRDESYKRTYTAPEAVTIKGSQKAIDSTDRIKAFETDISGIYENSEIPIEYDLPEGIYIADESVGQKLTVTVTKLGKSSRDDD